MIIIQMLLHSTFFFMFYQTPKWENNEDASRKEQKSDQFLLFCEMILKYEKYKPYKEDLNDSYSSNNSERNNNSSSSSDNNGSLSARRNSNEESKSSNTDTEDDSWDLITCYCMKPFAGRPMIECTVCATWIHMSCAKIRKKNIPEDFVCQFCRESKGNKRRSARIRTDDRRLLSA